MTQHVSRPPFAQASITLAASIALAACGTVQQDISRLEQTATQKYADESEKALQPIPVATRTSEAWLMGQSVQVTQPPSPLLTKKTVYNPRNYVTLADVAAHVSENTGLSVDTSEVWTFLNPQSALGMYAVAAVGSTLPSSSGPAPIVPPLSNPAMPMGMSGASGQNTQLNQQARFQVDYEGTYAGLLDLAANKSGVWWKFFDGKIVFYRTETKTFYLPALADKKSGINQITGSTGMSTGITVGSSNSTSNSSTGASTTSQYSVDIWTDLASTAQAVGGTAKVVANPSAGSITASGTPTQVRAVEEWVKGVSDNLSQQVAITLDVYTIKISKENNYSWDPSLVYKTLSGNYGFNLAAAQAPAIASGLNPFNFGVNVLSSATGRAAQYSGSQLAFNALSTLGKAVQTHHQTVITLNGRPAPIQIAKSTVYLASSTPSASVAIGAAPLPPTLTPGTVTTGFTALFLPRVVNGKVLLSMDMTNSTLDRIGSQGSGGALIQTPETSGSIFQQSASLTPGDALLLTAIQQHNGRSNHNGVGAPDNVLLGGGIDDTTDKQLTAIVVSAKVL